MIARTSSLLAIASALALAGPALAQGGSQPQAQTEPQQQPPASEVGGTAAHAVSFDQLDRNRDGMIGRDELGGQHELARLFDDYDSDDDGRLSRSELDSFLALDAAMPGPERRVAGADGDAGRDREAADAEVEPLLVDTERRREGVLADRSDSELGSIGAGSPRAHAGSSAEPPSPIDTLPPTFAQADRDGDGVIARSEVAESLGDRFDAIDSDGDGRLSRTEYNTWLAVAGTSEWDSPVGTQDDLDPALTRQDDEQEFDED